MQRGLGPGLGSGYITPDPAGRADMLLEDLSSRQSRMKEQARVQQRRRVLLQAAPSQAADSRRGREGLGEAGAGCNVSTNAIVCCRLQVSSW